MNVTSRPTAAVVGAEISGLAAAHLLSMTHGATLFEADTRLGGHVHELGFDETVRRTWELYLAACEAG